MVNAKHSFWIALVFTLIVFFCGMFLGVVLENRDANDLRLLAMNSEVSLLDEQLRGIAIQNFNVDCKSSEKNLFEFADRIYLEAERLEDYDSSFKFNEDLKVLHRKYDVLRFLLWNQAIELKSKCSSDFNIVIYFYEYDSDNVVLESKQKFYSEILLDLKNVEPDKILLIPISANSDLSSLNLAMQTRGVDEIPAVLVNEDLIITEISSFEDLKNSVFALQ